MSPGRVLAEHSSAELTEWRAFDRDIGLDAAEEWRAGVVAAEIWNAAEGVPTGEGPKAGRRLAEPKDFFPKFVTDDDAQQWVSHDDIDDESDADAAPVDDVESASEALKGVVTMWALKHNAAVRAAKRLEEEGRLEGQPPGDPEQN